MTDKNSSSDLSMRTIAVFLFIFVFGFPVSAQKIDRLKLAADVKAEFTHAWTGYKKYAWGHDDLKPLSKSFHDWHSEPLLMTPIDALDTMFLMGMKDEVTDTKQYIVDHLSFDKDIEVQNFEITIRLLGGLLSSYQLTGDKRLLRLADDLGTRLLPVFDTPTGMPYRYVNLKTGKVRDPKSNPAETGTLLIEFGTLAKLTGKQIYYDKAKRALVETYRRRSPIVGRPTHARVSARKFVSGAIEENAYGRFMGMRVHIVIFPPLCYAFLRCFGICFGW